MTHRWVPLVALRYTALAGFGAYQARPQQTPLVGAALVALAGGGHQQALWGAALMVTMTSVAAWAALNIQQVSGEVAPLTMEAYVAAALAARIPQPAPDGAAFVA